MASASDSRSERHDKTEKTSGLFSGGGIAVTVGTQEQRVKDMTTSTTAVATVSFKKANLSLKVKPQITPDGKVMMALDVNKDQPRYDRPVAGGNVPIDTKHVKTDVVVENGGTVVIGGIYIQDISNNTTKVPLLGDIPVLGYLFRNNERKDNKTELLVFITPHIVTRGG